MVAKFMVSLMAVWLFSQGIAAQAPAPAVPSEKLKIRILDTGYAPTLEALVYKGGSWFKPVHVVHPAFIIEHPKETILFDTGLGRKAHEQNKKDMPWWAALLTGFEQKDSAADILEREHKKIDRIILSHVHFDHASGITDFNVPVWITPIEREFTKTPASPAVLPSVFAGNIDWHLYEFENKPYEGFAQSLDLMGDGTLVLVPLSGHTPGSVGLFINLSPEKRIFMIGDTVWSTKAIEEGAPKFWIAQKFADNRPDQVMENIHKLQELKKRLPQLLIVPSHDQQAVEAMAKLVGSQVSF